MVFAKEYLIVLSGILSSVLLGSMVQGSNLRHSYSATQQGNLRRQFQEQEQEQYRPEESIAEEPAEKYARKFDVLAIPVHGAHQMISTVNTHASRTNKGGRY